MHIVTVLCIFYTFIHDLMYKSKFYAYFFGGKLEFMGIFQSPLPSPTATPSPRRWKANIGSPLDGELSNEVRLRGPINYNLYNQRTKAGLIPYLLILVIVDVHIKLIIWNFDTIFVECFFYILDCIKVYIPIIRCFTPDSYCICKCAFIMC